MSENFNEDSGEVPSIGGSGTSMRGDRLYHNATMYHDDISSVENVFTDMSQQMERDRGTTIGRVVFRGIVSPGAMRAISSHPLAGHLEVAQSLEEYGEPGWLIYLAENSRDRVPIVPVQRMIEETDSYEIPADFDPRILPAGITHRNHIPDESVTQLHNLWEAFDWELDGVRLRSQKVKENLKLPANQRDTWFGGLWAGNLLVCAATAERLTYNGANRPFDIVENTEWRTHTDYMQHGLMGRNLWRMNHQIIDDLRTENGSIPNIFAECNFMTRADKAGRRGGFEIPSRNYADQIVVHNVAVKDGHSPPGLRDFIYQSVPARFGEQP